MLLTVKQAGKRFHGQWVLQNIHFSINTPTIIGLTGPSGSGKSTLLRCIQQFEQVDSGRIELTGACGFMFQDYQLFPHMTVLENIVYAPQRLHKKADHYEIAIELLSKLHITDKQNFYPKQLSGGEKQRVALARSIMLKPSLLLCDEPTANLDEFSTQNVIDVLKSIHADGVSLIICSHDLYFLNQMADRFLLINQGQLIADLTNTGTNDSIAHLKQCILKEQLGHAYIYRTVNALNDSQ